MNHPPWFSGTPTQVEDPRRFRRLPLAFDAYQAASRPRTVRQLLADCHPPARRSADERLRTLLANGH